jgi:hypothetical protein
MLLWYDGEKIAGRLTQAEADARLANARLTDAELDALYPRRDVDPEFDAKMRAAGVRIPTRSLDRPRILVKPRPAWLAFLIRIGVAAGRLLGRIWNPKRNGSVQADLEEAELAAIWPTAIDWEGVERVGAVRIRRATRSLHRPRHVAERRPALLAFLLRVVGARV